MLEFPGAMQHRIAGDRWSGAKAENESSNVSKAARECGGISGDRVRRSGAREGWGGNAERVRARARRHPDGDCVGRGCAALGVGFAGAGAAASVHEACEC
jgi:hypothetical protein